MSLRRAFDYLEQYRAAARRDPGDRGAAGEAIETAAPGRRGRRLIQAKNLPGHSMCNVRWLSPTP